MIIDVLKELFERDLQKLKKEIRSYNKEENIWLINDGIKNSSGTLALHLVGNLKFFIGATLGNTGYERKRELEFSQRNVDREEILNTIDETLSVIENTLTSLSLADLAKNYPIEVFRRPMTTEYFLMHLSTHLNYHLGQVNYHRRLFDK